jgi:hypothetical protein
VNLYFKCVLLRVTFFLAIFPRYSRVGVTPPHFVCSENETSEVVSDAFEADHEIIEIEGAGGDSAKVDCARKLYFFNFLRKLVLQPS